MPHAKVDTSRAVALDALRGIAILAMVLSALIPFGEYHGMSLPPWMYHYQDVLPGTPGISWVDLVFPWFLFSMGAAIPIALTRRIDSGARARSLVWSVLLRGGLLAFFAYYVAHTRIGSFAAPEFPSTVASFVALLAFAFALLAFVRFPDAWPPNLRTGLRAAGWAGAVVMLFVLTGPGGERLLGDGPAVQGWLGGVDIIILVLANVYVAGSLIWLATRRSILARLAPLGFLLALKLASTVPGSWANAFWNWSPAPWLYRMEFMKYLFIIVPATVIGDWLVEWRRHSAAEPTRWDAGRLRMLAALALAPTPIVLWGTCSRNVLYAAGLCLASLGAALWLARDAKTPAEKFIRSALAWGTYWLMVGLVLEPYEGGITKTPSTLTYYLVPLGLGSAALAGLTVLLDILRWRGLGLLVANGQNPLLAYVGNTHLLAPFIWLASSAALRLTGSSIGQTMERVADASGSLWPGVLWGLAQTLLLAAVVAWFTRRRIFLRA